MTPWRERRITAIFVVITLVGLAVLGWIFFYNIYFLRNSTAPDLEERIDYVTLWVEIVGFSLAIVGAYLAVYQFQAAQRNPDLCLWFDELGQSERLLPSDLDECTVKLYLQNLGGATAAHIWIRIDIPAFPRIQAASITGEFSEKWSFRRQSLHELLLGSMAADTGAHLFMEEVLDRSGPALQEILATRVSIKDLPGLVILTFVGGGDFVCYSNNSAELGDLRLEFGWGAVKNPPDTVETPIDYSIRSEGMKEKRGRLTLKLLPRDKLFRQEIEDWRRHRNSTG